MRFFFSNIFNQWLVESADTEPADIEGCCIYFLTLSLGPTENNHQWSERLLLLVSNSSVQMQPEQERKSRELHVIFTVCPPNVPTTFGIRSLLSNE